MLKINFGTSFANKDIVVKSALAEMKTNDTLDFFIILAYNMNGGCEWVSHPHRFFFLSIITAMIAVIVVIIAHTEIIHS